MFVTVFKKFGFEIRNFKHWSYNILERYCRRGKHWRTGKSRRICKHRQTGKSRRKFRGDEIAIKHAKDNRPLTTTKVEIKKKKSALKQLREKARRKQRKPKRKPLPKIPENESPPVIDLIESDEEEEEMRQEEQDHIKQEKPKRKPLPKIPENESPPVIDLIESDEEEEEMRQEEQDHIKQENTGENNLNDTKNEIDLSNMPPWRDTVQERRRGGRNRQKTDFFGHNVMVTEIDGPQGDEQKE